MPTGPLPLWTFLHPTPPSLSPTSQLYSCCPSIPSCCCQRERPQVHQHGRRSASSSRRLNYIEPDPQVPREPRKKKNSRRERRVSEPSTEDLARTYTGMDREIAEEFIAIAMDKSRKRSRSNSLGGSYVREVY